MESKNKTGMLGVFLTAAELTELDLIVSLTSRNAFGADLLVTDKSCQRAWPVQVKTNRKSASFWLLNEHAERLKSDSHVYVFVNLRGKQRPEYLVLPSRIVAEAVCRETAKTGTVWYSFSRVSKPSTLKGEGWDEVFGEPDSN